MPSLHVLDWLVIGVYLAGMLGIGIWAMRQIHDPGGFLLGKRKMGRLMMIASTFGAATTANDPVSVASKCYKEGVSGVWLTLSYLFLTPIFWMMPPAYRRIRMVTMVDFIRMRYGTELAVFYNVIQTVVCTLSIGGLIKAASVTIVTFTGGAVSEFWWQLITAGLILAYGLPGGVIAAFATDIPQSVLIVILSFLLIPFAYSQCGGMAGVAEKVPAEFTRLFSTAVDEITPQWIFWFVLGNLFAIMSDTSRAGYGAARNEMAARSSLIGMLMKRICAVGWMMAGIFAVALYGVKQVNPDQVFGMMSRDLLPMGLRGLMAASILAAAMATVSNGMVFGASLILNNFYREYWVRNASPKHYLFAARVFSALIVLTGWAMATQVQSLVDYIITIGQVATVVGLPVACAVFWRRGTRAGAIAAAMVMAPLFFYGNMYGELVVHYLGWPLDAYVLDLAALRIPFLDQCVVKGDLPLTVWTPLYLVPGAVIFLIVSLLTRQHDAKSVAEFYARLDTPVGDEAELVKQGIRVDLLENLDGEGVTVAAKDRDLSRRLLLVDLLTFPYRLLTGRGRLSDYKWDFVGIALVGAFAAAVIGVVAWFAAAGRAS